MRSRIWGFSHIVERLDELVLDVLPRDEHLVVTRSARRVEPAVVPTPLPAHEGDSTAARALALAFEAILALSLREHAFDLAPACLGSGPVRVGDGKDGGAFLEDPALLVGVEVEWCPSVNHYPS